MIKQRYICPVCGFDGLKEPPYNEVGEPSYEVCVCCGFEFGFDESEEKNKYSSFRKKWLESGAPWFIQKLKPSHWNFKQQLKNITP